MNTNQVARIASLVGEPARTAMLLALMDGRALTAQELASAAHVQPATASQHLALMAQGGLLSVARQGRHRYHRLASPEVAHLLESIMQVAAQTMPAPRRIVTGPRDDAMRLARTCYDHLAGRIAVAITQHLQEEGAVEIGEESAHLTDRAPTVFAKIGLVIDTAPCRPCLDWGERRMHLAGRTGSMLCAHCLEQGWLLRTSTRALKLRPSGASALRNWLGVARWTTVLDTEPASA